MSDFLAEMAAKSRARVAAARQQKPDARLQAEANALPPPPVLRLSAARFDLIAELKLRSPAVGELKRADEDSTRRVQEYAEAGAAIVSVLTEPSRFDGELSHLAAAAQALRGRAAVMRKDFITDPYQVYEARVSGAGGVLVILRMLSRAEIEPLLEASAALGLFALLEAFDAADIERAHELVARHRARLQLLVGVNCRDLGTLQVVPGRLEELVALLPAEVPRVAESGVLDAADAARLAAAGYELALVGSALMRAREPRELVRAMLAAGRAARTRRCG
jgi:indole-3-glycerol phosphate synthase